MTEPYDEIPDRPRELRLAAAFVALAGGRPDDALDGLTLRCVDLLDAGAAGLMLTDAHGRPRPASASDERARRLTACEDRFGAGPCLDCCRLAAPVTCPDLSAAEAWSRWPRLAALARDDGLAAAHVVPLAHGRRTLLGALALFRPARGALPDLDAALAQALAEAAAIGLMRERALDDSERRAGQLQQALDSRVVVEQAKGVLAERWGVRPDTAFTALRGHARSHRARLADLARQVVDRTLDPESLRDLRNTP